MADKKVEKQDLEIEAPVIAPPIETVAELPKVETPKDPEPIPIRPEMDTRLSHGVRILAFLESRKTGEFIKLNDFLKSLWPMPKPGVPAGFLNTENMRFLKMTLRQLKDDGKVVFSNNSFDRLGKHYYNGSDPKTQYHNVTTVSIEAKLAEY